MKLTFNDTALEVSANGKVFELTLDDKTVLAELLHSEHGRLDLLIDGKRLTAYVSSDNAKRWVTIDGQTCVLTRSSGARTGRHAGHHAVGELTAPMPGQIRSVNVSEGDAVTKGQTLLVLEAMKMEIRIHAPQDGIVKKLFVMQGETVERERILIDIEDS